jgi:hypothetical protein
MKTPGLGGIISADGARHLRSDVVTFASASAASIVVVGIFAGFFLKPLRVA